MLCVVHRLKIFFCAVHRLVVFYVHSSDWRFFFFLTLYELWLLENKGVHTLLKILHIYICLMWQTMVDQQGPLAFRQPRTGDGPTLRLYIYPRLAEPLRSRGQCRSSTGNEPDGVSAQRPRPQTRPWLATVHLSYHLYTSLPSHIFSRNRFKLFAELEMLS